ncbi:CpsB/CapC family capsule biosynthesis tyrosine phosphatase [Carnobacterium sp. AT7]
MEDELVHFIASDAHNTTSRRFYMKEAYQQIEKEFGLKKKKIFRKR